ncbi:FAD-dependent oxidoreductase [Actinoplanes sp. NPDC051475]|uniref:FAD-dependent oxidoreductase n=1 Tax=Actinoplanes sp. NPDC051475 TaxID=3157225 RepID=UPI00344E391D
MTNVTVLGGGIIGLTAAVRLQERGARVTVVADRHALDTVSAVAAAVWYPTHTDGGERVLRWATRTRAELLAQARARVPGVLLRDTRMLLRTPIGEPPWWAPGDASLTSAPEPYAQQLRFAAPLAEMDVYLPWLQHRIVAAGGRFVHRRVTRPEDLLAETPVVVHATGLAAADPAMVPVRGQIVLVPNPGLRESVRDEDSPAGITYVHPRRHDVVLGGTFEEGRADLTPDAASRAAIVRRCTALVPELAGTPVYGDRIGIRPARRGGPRVAAEEVAGGRVVHAYGHGGAGVTLSWGCADEVADLALA